MKSHRLINANHFSALITIWLSWFISGSRRKNHPPQSHSR